MNCQENQNPEEQPFEGCTALTYQSAAVSVPITVRPAEALSGCPYIECGDVSGKMCENCGG